MDGVLAHPGYGFGLVGLLAVLGFTAVIALGTAAARRDRERVAALTRWAVGRDWTVSDAGIDDLERVLPGSVFRTGRSRRCRNLVRGRLGGLPLTAFDYSYVTTDGTQGANSTTSSTTHHVQVLLVTAAEPWPPVSATAHGIFSRLAVTLGGQDVVIGHEPFDRAFRVKAEDDQAARRLLEPLATPLLARPEQSLELADRSLVLYRQGVLEPADLEAWLAELDGPVGTSLGRRRLG